MRVDKEEIYDILDQMRATIPEEIKQARWIVKERQEMLAEAKREAERIIREAREEQIRLIGEEEIVKQAERQADEIIEDARAREREIRLGAEDYADDILNTLEVNLTKFIAAVQRGRDRLQGREEAEVGSARPPPTGPGLGRPGRGSCLTISFRTRLACAATRTKVCLSATRGCYVRVLRVTQRRPRGQVGDLSSAIRYRDHPPALGVARTGWTGR